MKLIPGMLRDALNRTGRPKERWHFGWIWYMMNSRQPDHGCSSGENLMRRQLNSEKALEALLYVANRQSNMYCALKVIYFADKEHLARYGRLMFGDHYIAMRAGPVPSATYDLIKYVRGDGFFVPDVPVKDVLAIEGNTLQPRRGPNLDRLSESEIECLEISLDRYGGKSGPELFGISHQEKAFKEADENDEISLESIAASLPDGKVLIQHLLDA